MRARVFGPPLAAALLLVPAAPAAAGGWWSSIDLDGGALGVGETVTATAHVMFDDLARAEAARSAGGYHAYLLRGFDRSRLEEAMARGERHGWWEPLDDVTHLGAVELSDWNSNLATATATFDVPDVPPGTYELMFCTLDCAEPLADLVPTLDVRVFGDASAAQVARDVAGLREQLHESASAVETGMGGLRDDVRALAGSVKGGASATTALAASLDELRAASAELAPAPPSPGWVASGGWFVAGAATALALTGRRRRAAPASDTPVEPPEVLATSGPAPEFITRS